MARLLDKRFLNAGAFPLDGFDISSDFSYQMVPVDGAREIVVETDKKAPAKLTFSRQGIALVGNFHDFESHLPLPDLPENKFVNTFDLPADRKIQFTVKGFASGITSMNVADVAGPDQFPISFDLLVSVKPLLERKFCFVFISDLARKSVRGKIEPRFLLDSVKKIYVQQANIRLTDIDEGLEFREVHIIPFDLGDPLDVTSSADPRVDKGVDDAFFDLKTKTDFVVHVVWRVVGKHKQKLLGVNLQTASKLNTVYLGLEPTAVPGRIHTMAHEFGHAMGLPHSNENCLMFPNLLPSNRLLAGHIEQLHSPLVFPILPKP